MVCFEEWKDWEVLFPHATQRPAFAQTLPISVQRKGQRAFSRRCKYTIDPAGNTTNGKIQYTIFPLWLSLSHATTPERCKLIVSSCCPK